MPHFFFHYHTPIEVSRDDLGCSFETLDLAYLDAYRSMVEIAAELLKAQKDPNGHWIEIADAGGHPLMELRFDEIVRRRFQPASFDNQMRIKRDRLAHFQKVRGELRDVCAMARKSVDRAHEVLRRAKAVS